jgi:tRNA dimethylallyltransferase
MHEAAAFFLVGPTASGKSAVVHQLAVQRGCAVVSADSMNVYRGMDIGTAKPTEAERQAVHYYGVDVVEPASAFNVAEWLKAVASAWSEAEMPVVCGGTGLYVKCLTEGLDSPHAENSDLRNALATLTVKALQARVLAAMPEGYEALTEDDRENPRRLIRLLERGGQGMSWGAGSRVKMVGLQLERELLHHRIEQRVESMYAAGLLEEAEKLIDQPLSKTAQQAIGYAEAFACLKGTCSEGAAKERTVIRTRQLAKRQMTWFRNQLAVEWVPVEASATVEATAEAVARCWEQIGSGKVKH